MSDLIKDGDAVNIAVDVTNKSLGESTDKVTATMSTGVVLSCKTVHVTLMRDVQDAWLSREPKPPVFFVETKGRSEENKDDPDFQKAHAKWNEDMIMSQINTIVLNGLEVVSIPDGMDDWKITKQEQTYLDKHDVVDYNNYPMPDWIQDIYFSGYEVNVRSVRHRFLCWVKYKACPSAGDLDAIGGLITNSVGVGANGTNNAVKRF